MTCVNCFCYFLCAQKGELYNETDKSKEMKCRFFISDEEYIKPVVCGSCKFYRYGLCDHHIMGHDKVCEDDFCSYGQKK